MEGSGRIMLRTLLPLQRVQRMMTQRSVVPTVGIFPRVVDNQAMSKNDPEVIMEASEQNIVEKIEDYLNTYMVFADPDHAKVIALWTLHTWTFSDSFPIAPMTTPYLYVNSLEPGAGKTLLIDLLEPLALNSERTIDMTGSVLFTLIENVKPTMFIDEVDAIWSGAKNEALRSVLNGGYKHSGYVWRKVGQEAMKFRTFSPKLLAGIDNGHLPATVQTRSIEIMLERVARLDEEGRVIAPDGSPRDIYYSFMAEETADQIVREIEAFIATWAARYQRYMPKPIPGIAPRQFELAFPLLQVAHAVGIEQEAREALTRLFTQPRPTRETPSEAMLRTIRETFDELGADKLHSETILLALNENLGGGWNGKLLGNRLRDVDVPKSTTLNVGNRAAKGYYRHQFEKAWSRYL